MTWPLGPISDGVVMLRAPTSGDIDAVFEAAAESVVDIYPWMEWCHPGYQRHETAAWIEEGNPKQRADGGAPFLVIGVDDGRVLGGAGVNHVNRIHKCANLGYWTRSTATGQGLAVRTARLAAISALRDARLSRVEIVMDMRNEQSRRVAEKLGAVRESTARHRLWAHDAAHDAYVYSLTRDDLPMLLAAAGLGE